MVFSPTLANMRRAACLACSAWGGKFFPFVDPGDVPAIDRLVDALSLDALVDINHDPLSAAVARRPGVVWRGMAGDAFGEPDDIFAGRLQGPEWLLNSRPRNLVLPSWEASHPLADLFTVWFGCFGDSNYEKALASRFAEQAERRELSSVRDLQNVLSWVTPVELTGSRIDCRAAAGNVGFVLIDPASEADLALFWNVRAQGDFAFPWLAGQEEALGPAAKHWFGHVCKLPNAAHVRTGAGEDFVEPVLWTRDESEVVPDLLRELIEARSWRLVTPDTMLPWGWSGSHPLSAGFSRMFSGTLSAQDLSLGVAVPRNGPGWEQAPGEEVGVVAAQVTIFSESGLPSGQTISVPGIRELADVLDQPSLRIEPFQWPTGEGRVVGVRADDDEVRVRPVASMHIFKRLIAETGRTIGQSDSGRFASRLIDMLGGVDTQVGNQPAMRWVLDEAARATRGRAFPHLEGIARRNQGRWPGWPPESEEAKVAYPRQVVDFLLQQEVVRVFLPVKCPACALTSALTPETIQSRFRCEWCSNEVPLGLALSLMRKPAGWLYKLADNVPEANLRETLPIMAALSVFATWSRFTSPCTPPHVLGLEVHSPQGDLEVDLAMILEDRSRPVAVVGEAKSWKKSIDATDLENLARVQQYFRGKGIECLMLVTTFRDVLDAGEQELLRSCCENAPRTLERHYLRLALPIVLTANDLSVPRQHGDHPGKWGERGLDMPDLALESCRRNLGLKDVVWKGGGGESDWQLKWAHEAAQASSDVPREH